MNHLAHIFLSGNNPDIQVGNFMGDTVKGKKYQKYPANIQTGILLHRYIDSFTDRHPIISRSKKRLHRRYKHYAGILIDLFYDHFLSANWREYSEQPLSEFVDTFYRVLEENKAILTQETQALMSWLIPKNGLIQYGKIEGIHRALCGIQKRIVHDIPLHLGTEDMIKNYETLKADFSDFFPLLQAYSEEMLQKLERR